MDVNPYESPPPVKQAESRGPVRGFGFALKDGALRGARTGMIAGLYIDGFNIIVGGPVLLFRLFNEGFAAVAGGETLGLIVVKILAVLLGSPIVLAIFGLASGFILAPLAWGAEQFMAASQQRR